MKSSNIVLSINDRLSSFGGSVDAPCVVSFFAKPFERESREGESDIFAVSVRHAFKSAGGRVFAVVEGENRYIGEMDDGFVSKALRRFDDSALVEAVFDVGMIRLDRKVEFKNEISGIECKEFTSGADIILSKRNDVWIGRRYIGRVEEVLLDVEMEFSDGSSAEMEVFRVANDGDVLEELKEIPAGSLAIDSEGRAAGILVGGIGADLFFVDAQAIARYLNIELAKTNLSLLNEPSPL